MAERETGSGGWLADLANSTSSAVRDIAARNIDTSASFAKQIVDFQAQTTSWAKDTPMGPMFESQYSFNQGLIELWVRAARALFRIEEAKPDGASSSL